jgi:hypothetical protein
MVSSDSIMADFMPWDIRLEYEMYVQKNAHVSAGMLNTERACHCASLIL